MSLKENFKKDLIDDILNVEEVFSKYYLDNSSYFFTEIVKDISEEYNLRRTIATNLGIFQREIVLLGSGKVGFSIKPTLEPVFQYEFKDFKSVESDLDFAIVSSSYFETVSDAIFEKYHNNQMSQWKDRKSFMQYYFKGWIRLEYLPENFILTDSFKAFLLKEANRLNVEGINLGIFKNWKYLFRYQEKNISQIKINLISK